MKQFMLIATGLLITACTSIDSSNDIQPLSNERVTIYKDAVKKQCFGDGIALETMSSTLSISGVTVFCAERHNDGMVYPQVCGNDEGTINVFSISKSDLETAKTLGFKEVSELKSAQIKTSCAEVIKN